MLNIIEKDSNKICINFKFKINKKLKSSLKNILKNQKKKNNQEKDKINVGKKQLMS